MEGKPVKVLERPAKTAVRANGCGASPLLSLFKIILDKI